ncbi:MAG: hypothetical protein Q9173_006840 [Seirophora scorigena]
MLDTLALSHQHVVVLGIVVVALVVNIGTSNRRDIPMEFSSPYLPIDFPWSVICVAVLCIYIAYLVVRSGFFQPGDEAPVHYEVPLPEQAKPGWSGKILEKPTIKIPGSSVIQCYDPATGQLLGNVNPATPDGIDRAVARAAEAQQEWAKTTFTQRRKVLRTMLKYVGSRKRGLEKWRTFG